MRIIHTCKSLLLFKGEDLEFDLIFTDYLGLAAMRENGYYFMYKVKIAGVVIVDFIKDHFASCIVQNTSFRFIWN